MSQNTTGWKGMGKASKQDSEQGSGRTARWQRIADAASKQSLRCDSLHQQSLHKRSYLAATQTRNPGL